MMFRFLAALLTAVFLAVGLPAQATEFESVSGLHAGGSKVWWWNMEVKAYVPDSAKGRPGPVVMLLHGCKQEGVPFAISSGWRDLAERRGFALLVAEFKDFVAPFGTSGKDCLWWFDEDQRNTSDLNQTGLLRQAVLKARETYGISSGENFIVGLSAGGAMAQVVLTTYPDDFAAGASVAGIAVGCSTIGTVKGGYMTMPPELRRAFGCMEGPAGITATDWAREAARINPNRFRWPRLSIWQGDADPTVKCVNAVQIAQQWAGLHHGAMPGFTSCEEAPLAATPFAPVWTSGNAVELRILPGLDHAMPVVPKAGCGSDDEYVKGYGVCATSGIAEFFGIK